MANSTILTLLLVVGIALALLYKNIRELFSFLHNRKVITNIKKRDEYRRSILEYTKADGVTFFKTHNHDGRTSHTKDYKITCVRGTRFQEKTFTDLVVDEDYILMLDKICHEGSYDYVLDNDRDTLMNYLFKKCGIKRTIVFYIRSTYTGIFYMKVCKKTEEPFSPQDIEVIKKYVKKIRGLSNVYHNF